MDKVVGAVVGKGGVGPPSGTTEGPMSSRVRTPQSANESARGEVSGCDGNNSLGGGGVRAPKDAPRVPCPKALPLNAADAACLA